MQDGDGQKLKVVFACTAGSGTAEFSASAFEKYLELSGLPVGNFEIVRANFMSRWGMEGVSPNDPVIVMDHLKNYAEESIRAGILAKAQVFYVPYFLYSPDLIRGLCREQPAALRIKFGKRNLFAWGKMVMKIIREKKQPRIRPTKPIFRLTGGVYKAAFPRGKPKPRHFRP